MKKILVTILAVTLLAGCGIIQESTQTENIQGLTENSIQSPTSEDIVTGSKVNYSVTYNKDKWILQTSEKGSDSEYVFTHVDGDVEAQIIPERLNLSISSLKKIALDNAKDVAPDAKITFEETRKVNGVDVLAMKMEGTIDGIAFIYYGYYFTGKNASIQFITYTGTNLFTEYEDDFTELLNGLKIDESLVGEISANETPLSTEDEVIAGAKVKYQIKYNPEKWIIENSEPGDTAEYYFTHMDGDVYGMVIPERLQIDASGMKKIALSNAKEAAPDAAIIFEETRKVNGKDLMVLQITGTIEGIKFHYYGYYYTGKSGTIQLLMYTSDNLFDEYKQEMEELLNGLTVEE